MTEETDSVETTDEAQAQDGESTESTAEEEAAEEEDPTAGLKRALAAERKARREAERKATAASNALADRDKEPAEQALEQARREALEQAQERFNQRLATAEVKAAIAGKVTNPALAMRVIDTSEIEVDADGNVDPQSVTDAIEAALTEYPELAVAQNKFGGTADQGARQRSTRPVQITREQLKSMSPEQIVEAEANGQLRDIVGAQS